MRITIKNVSEEVRDQLAAHAASRHQSMQQFLLEELERIVSKPSREALLDRIRQRVDASGRGVSTETMLALRDDERLHE